jgi:hypothetical protein
MYLFTRNFVLLWPFRARFLCPNAKSLMNKCYVLVHTQLRTPVPFRARFLCQNAKSLMNKCYVLVHTQLRTPVPFRARFLCQNAKAIATASPPPRQRVAKPRLRPRWRSA